MKTNASIAVSFAALVGAGGVAAAADDGADNGMIAKQSPHSVEATAAGLEAAARDKGLIVFPRIDHAAAAREVGLEMPPTVVVSFGNPKYGTPIMVEHPQAGIDFPPSAIVYEDDGGQVWLAYNSAEYIYKTIFERHGISYKDSELSGMENLLEALSEEALEPSP